MHLRMFRVARSRVNVDSLSSHMTEIPHLWCSTGFVISKPVLTLSIWPVITVVNARLTTYIFIDVGEMFVKACLRAWLFVKQEWWKLSITGKTALTDHLYAKSFYTLVSSYHVDSGLHRETFAHSVLDFTIITSVCQCVLSEILWFF